MKIIKKLLLLGIGILLLFLLIICIINAIRMTSFWEINIGQAFTIFTAILIAFLATQFKTDERKMKEVMERIILKIQGYTTDKNFIVFTKEEDKDSLKKRVGVSNRSIKNSIEILKKYSKEFGFNKEVDYIESQFKEYNELISEKIEDIDYLSKSENQLKKFAENINNKCEEMLFKLYRK